MKVFGHCLQRKCDLNLQHAVFKGCKKFTFNRSWPRNRVRGGIVVITEGKFVKKTLEFSYEKYARFSIECIEESECFSESRVEKKDLPLLADALGLPDGFHYNQRTTADKLEGLCILLRRMSSPFRYTDMLARFRRPVPELSLISNTVMNYIYDLHGHKLCQWNHEILNPRYFDTYTDAISNKGAALQNCFGFIDGTIRLICRPSQEQRIMYNGHKRVHSWKFQSVTVPNGLIANLFGAVG